MWTLDELDIGLLRVFDAWGAGKQREAFDHFAYWLPSLILRVHSAPQEKQEDLEKWLIELLAELYLLADEHSVALPPLQLDPARPLPQRLLTLIDNIVATLKYLSTRPEFP